MNRDFNTWLSGFRDSIADYGYYIDFEKVHRNVDSVKIELNILNSLIGSKNIEEDFENLLNKYPEVLKCIPLLLAVRANEIYCQDKNGGYLYQFDRLIEQQNLLCHNDIETDEQLQAYKQECINEMAEVTEARRIYRNKLKSAVRKGDEKEIAEIKDTISLFSERLKILRKDINTCERIEKSEPDVENKIDQILEIEQQQKNKTQNRSRGYSRDER